MRTKPDPRPDSARRARRWAIAVAIGVAATVTACGGAPAATVELPSATAPTTATTSMTAPAEAAPVRDTTLPEVPAGSSLVARITAPTEVRAEPDPAAAVVATVEPLTELGSPTSLLVVDGAAGWLEVALPVRPNGSTGFVPAASVELLRNDFALAVDLTARRLTLTRAGAEVLSTPVAVGAPAHPTPAGRFFVTDLVDTPDPGGAYGPYALGLSGHSETLTEFAGGDGQIGVHGTDDPSSIGRDVSHGCVRVPNDVVEQLASMLPLGTPVTIV